MKVLTKRQQREITDKVIYLQEILGYLVLEESEGAKTDLWSDGSELLSDLFTTMCPFDERFTEYDSKYTRAIRTIAPELDNDDNLLNDNVNDYYYKSDRKQQ